MHIYIYTGHICTGDSGLNMETLNLQLFDENTLVIDPPVELNNDPIPELPTPTSPLDKLEQTLATIFPDNQEETKVSKARKILGEIADTLPDEKLESLVTDFEYLADSWLDVFEKRVFGGKTLKEVIGTSANENTK